MEGGREKSTAVPRMFLRAVFQRLAGTPATHCKTWSLIDLKKSPSASGLGTCNPTQDMGWRKDNILLDLACTFCDFNPSMMIAVWKTAVATIGRHQETLEFIF